MRGDDREMCGMMRNGLARIATLWTDIQREFHRAMATSVEQADKDRLTTSMEDYRTRYKTIMTRALQVTAPLFNIMEKERLELEAGRRATGGGGARASPKVDESFCPQFKAAFTLSLDEFRKWEEGGNSMGPSIGPRLETTIGPKSLLPVNCGSGFL